MTIGDSLVIDTKENVGYLVHEDGGYTAFPVATGQRRIVRYIGRTYDATTPNRSWTIEKEDKKGDHITFGKSGRFLRLNKHAGDDDDESAYGIHSHAYADKMLGRADRYRSMGCVIVTENMLDVIEATFRLNADRLRVVTVNGLGEELATLPLLQNIVQANGQKDL